MPLENPNDLLRRQSLDKLAVIKQSCFVDEPIIVPAIDQNEDSQVYFRYLDALNTGPSVSHLVVLERMGIIMLPAQMLNDEELSEKLWEVIDGLAECQVFLSSTDHLGDRELYEHLRTELLLDEHPDLPMGIDACIQMDMLGSWSEEDMHHYNKYYADEEYRQRIKKEYPGEPMPDHADPPYERDRYLPKHQLDWPE